MTQKYAIILLFPMAGCGWGHWLYDKNTYEARLAKLTDQDGDGFSSVEGDCDDTDASIYPNAEEVCDGKDNRCEGVVDAGEHLVGAPVWFLDSDQDGHGDDSRSLSACIPPEGYIDQGGDCDDLAVHISPDAAEICNDFIDNDCDGTDNGCALQGSLTTEDADHFFFGSAAGDGIGVSLADGDLNGDGYGDLLIGATHGNAAYVASGRDLEVVTFLAEDEGALVRGASLSNDYILAQAVGICDVDQDGWQDALVSGLHYGARSDLWIFDGPLTNSRSTDAAFAQIVGEGTTDFLGNTIACGDIDGDGSDDLLIGAALHSASAVADDREVGAVYLITGSPIDTGDTTITDIAQKITGDETGMHLGAYVALADLNGDGDLDGLLGATESSIAGEDAGAVYGFFSLNQGLSPLEDADIVVGGTDPRGRLAVLDAGDLNGDGYDEIAIGGDRIDSSAVDAGAIYIFAGSASMQQQHTPTTADGRVIGEREGDRAGIGLHITDDIDQDGSPELAISIGFADTTAPEAGEVLLFSPWVLGGESLGYTDSMLRIAGTDTSGLLGFSINGRADMNQDGYPDLSITGLGYDDSGQDSGATFVLLGHGL